MLVKCKSYGGKLFENPMDDIEFKNKHYDSIICEEITTNQLFNYEEMYLNYKILRVNISLVQKLHYCTYYKNN